MSQWSRLLRLAAAEVASTVQSLPEPLRESAARLPVTYEAQPSAELEADGVEPDTLGLFVGEALAETGSTTAPLPSQIILFLENLWDCAEGEEAVFLEEVHTTYLHELGHFLGLDEDDLVDRGLE